jgi:hypothetical protein
MNSEPPRSGFSKYGMAIILVVAIIFPVGDASAGRLSTWGSSWSKSSYSTFSRSTTFAKKPLTVQQKAGQLNKSIRQNTVTIQRGNGSYNRYDLVGRSHYDKAVGKKNVTTPHMVEGKVIRNVRPSDGRSFQKIIETQPRAMTHGDLRTVQRVLRDRQGQ